MNKKIEKTEEKKELREKPKKVKKKEFMTKAQMAIAKKIFLRPPEEGELNI